MIRTWICPALCGCELDIDAEWSSDAVMVGGRPVMHQHPRTGTIQAVTIAAVCAEHEHFCTDALPADPYDGSPGYLQLTTQTNLRRLRRYLSDEEAAHEKGVQFEAEEYLDDDGVTLLKAAHPYVEVLDPDAPAPRDPATLTKAERLYVCLWCCQGQVWRPDTCGCVIYQTYDRRDPNAKTQCCKHHHHTQKCRHHRNDTDDHAQAVAENRAKNEDVGVLLAKYPDLTHDDIVWSFDARRRLTVSAPTKGTVLARGIVKPQ